MNVCDVFPPVSLDNLEASVDELRCFVSRAGMAFQRYPSIVDATLCQCLTFNLVETLTPNVMSTFIHGNVNKVCRLYKLEVMTLDISISEKLMDSDRNFFTPNRKHCFFLRDLASKCGW